MDREYLTAEQRTRLRPTIDVTALERLLAALPPESRLPVILACVRMPTRAELTEIGFEVPDTSALALLPPASFDMAVRIDDPALAALWAAVERQPSG
jgi:hypothetical protein